MDQFEIVIHFHQIWFGESCVIFNRLHVFHNRLTLFSNKPFKPGLPKSWPCILTWSNRTHKWIVCHFTPLPVKLLLLMPVCLCIHCDLADKIWFRKKKKYNHIFLSCVWSEWRVYSEQKFLEHVRKFQPQVTESWWVYVQTTRCTPAQLRCSLWTQPTNQNLAHTRARSSNMLQIPLVRRYSWYFA